MRPFILLLISVQLFTGCLPGDVLMKLPRLASHFRVHQITYPKATWFGFFRLHYLDALHRNADPAHRQLPLRAVSTDTQAPVFFPVGFEPCVEKTDFGCDEDLPCISEVMRSCDFRKKVLQPPRI